MPRTAAWKEAQARLSAPEAARGKRPTVAEAIQPPDRTVLDLVDNLLNRGVLLNGELNLALADVDLVYLRLSLLLAAADRILGPAPGPASPAVAWVALTPRVTAYVWSVRLRRY